MDELWFGWNNINTIWYKTRYSPSLLYLQIVIAKSKYNAYLSTVLICTVQSNIEIVSRWVVNILLPRLIMLRRTAQLRDISVQKRLPKWRIRQKQKASGKQNYKRKNSAITANVLTECVTIYLKALRIAPFDISEPMGSFELRVGVILNASKLSYPKSDAINVAMFNS